MPRVPSRASRIFKLGNLKLDIIELNVNVTEPRLFPAKDVESSTGNSMRKGLHRRSRRVSRPSRDNAAMTFLII